MNQKSIAIAFFFCLLGLSNVASANGTGNDAMPKNKVYSIFLYQFARYVEWPAEVNKTNFVIGVYGTNDLTQELKDLAGTKKVNDLPIEVKQIDHASDIGQCHILFVPNVKGINMEAITREAESNHVLIVTENINDALTLGASVNFVEVGARMNFELNVTEAAACGLKVSSSLKQLASTVL